MNQRNKQMILKEFYLNKKECIETEMSFSGFIPDVTLYNTNVLKSAIKTPTLLFKYNSVHWETFSEQTRKADVSFCIYVILPKEGTGEHMQQYESVFDFSKSIDKAILSTNEKIEGITTIYKTISTSKVMEKQYMPNNQEGWGRSAEHFIWELSYKTILTESNVKNYYNVIDNQVVVDSQNHTHIQNFSGPFVSLENHEMYEIINTPLNNN